MIPAWRASNTEKMTSGAFTVWVGRWPLCRIAFGMAPATRAKKAHAMMRNIRLAARLPLAQTRAA